MWVLGMGARFIPKSGCTPMTITEKYNKIDSKGRFIQMPLKQISIYD